MNRDEAINEARTVLERLHDRYGHEGIESICLHGSILFDDFDPETSDVDSVAIAEDRLDFDYEDEMRQFLREQDTPLPDLGVRILYRSELDGEKPRGHLATVVNPTKLVYAFPDWKHVAGDRLRAENFDLAPVRHDEMVELHLSKIVQSREVESGDWRYAPGLSDEAYPYYVKSIARLIHARQSHERGERRPFSYSGLLDDAAGLEEDVVRAILELRETRDHETFQEHADQFQTYVERLAHGDYERSIRTKREEQNKQIVT